MDKATALLQHYFRTAFEAAGKPWDSDNDAEIEEAVDYIVDAAVERVYSKRRLMETKE